MCRGILDEHESVGTFHLPKGAQKASTEQAVDDWICDTIERRKGLEVDGNCRVHLDDTIDEQNVVNKVRTPAENERCNVTICYNKTDGHFT